MVLMLDGNSEIDAHTETAISVIREQSQIRVFFYPKRPIFYHAYATCSELPSNISTIGRLHKNGKISKIFLRKS